MIERREPVSTIVCEKLHFLQELGRGAINLEIAVLPICPVNCSGWLIGKDTSGIIKRTFPKPYYYCPVSEEQFTTVHVNNGSKLLNQG